MFLSLEVGEVKLDKIYLDIIVLYLKFYGGALFRFVVEVCRGTRRVGFAGLFGEYVE